MFSCLFMVTFLVDITFQYRKQFVYFGAKFPSNDNEFVNNFFPSKLSRMHLNPEATSFIPKTGFFRKMSEFGDKNGENMTPSSEELRKIINCQIEDIISLKLLYFEAKIELNQKEEEINRLKTIVSQNLEMKNIE